MQSVVSEKVPVQPIEENIENEGGVFFDKYEWKNFLVEIKDMIKDGKEIDFQKAINNARYLAIIDKGIEQMNNGGGHTVNDEELRSMIYDT